MKNDYLIWFGAALLLIVIVSSCDCGRVVPYSMPQTYSTYEGFEEEEEQDEGFEEEEQEEGFEEEEEEQKEEFGTMYGEPYATLNPFGGTPGAANCAKSSGGLSNSKGPLCLSNEQQMLLRTRGGNASSGEAQIGSP